MPVPLTGRILAYPALKIKQAPGAINVKRGAQAAYAM